MGFGWVLATAVVFSAAGLAAELMSTRPGTVRATTAASPATGGPGNTTSKASPR